MPLFDFQCERCGRIKLDVLIPRRDVLVPCPTDIEHGPMTVLPSSPSFIVKGFSAKNGYNGGQEYEVKVKEKDMRVIVKS